MAKPILGVFPDRRKVDRVVGEFEAVLSDMTQNR